MEKLVETGHLDMVQDAQTDFGGTKIATCFYDGRIRIFDINPQNGRTSLQEELKGHEGPVWEVSWSHPRYNNILASCSSDSRVILWKEGVDPMHFPKWERLYTYQGHQSSVNSICWAPHEWGQILACGSSDGTISLLSSNNFGKDWEARKILDAHLLGCNAVSWSTPFFYPTCDSTQGEEDEEDVKRFASGGCDGLLKIWKETGDEWMEEFRLKGHTDWIQGVAWAPGVGTMSSTKIASCSQDKTVIIWSYHEDGNNWSPKLIFKSFDDEPVWRVSWNLVGEVLAISWGDNQVKLWKQTMRMKTGAWKCISDLEQDNNSSNGKDLTLRTSF